MPPKKAKKSGGGCFDGLTFCVSGAFSISQAEMKSQLEENGGKIASTVSNAVTHVVSDAIQSSKTHTAVGKGLPIVSEEWVTTSIDEGSPSEDASLFVHNPDGPAKKSGKAPKKTASKKGKKKDDDEDDEEEEEEEEEEKPKKKSAPIKKVAVKKAKGGDVFEGLTFCVSGAFSMSQNEMKSLIEDNGGKIAGTVTKAVTHVVSDQIGSGKTQNAVDKGIPVVSEEWITTSIDEGAPSTDKSLFVSSGGDDGDDGDDMEDEEEQKPKKKVATKAAPKKRTSRKRKKGEDEDDEEEPEEDDDGGDDEDGDAGDGDAEGDGVLKGLVFALLGKTKRPKDQFKDLFGDHGGKLAKDINAAGVTHAIVMNEKVDEKLIQPAVDKGLTIVTEDWIEESCALGSLCTEAKWILSTPSAPFKSSSSSSSSSSTRTSGRARKPTKQADDDDDDDDEEEEEVKKPAKKSTAKSTAKKGKKDDDDDDEDEEDEDDEPPTKKAKTETKSEIKKVIVKKGSAPVDEHAPGAASCTVYQEGSDVWDAMLNQTNIGQNNNKYYVVQLLQTADGSYQVWTKWGRVGKIAGKAMFPCGKDLAKAKKTFESKFRDKTKNNWADRASFTPVRGKYTLLERDYSADDEDMEAADDDDGETKTNGNTKNNKGYPDSKLDPRVQDLVKLICDVKMMEAALLEVGYDAKKLPLGKLSKRHIQSGYSVLQQISDAIDKGKSGSTLAELSSDFYTLIPHDFGMKVPPVIRDKVMLKEKLTMVEQLADIEIATKLLKGDSANHKVNPLDAHYEHLKCNMTPLDHDSEEVKLIKKYVKNTHAATHKHYSLDVLEVFDLERDGEAKRYAAYEDNENRQLLWHGSRLTNFVGILSQGLRIAPPEAPVTGYMFGKGVYFADMVSKSANYCSTSRDSNIACMLLCEVALGGMNQKLAADYHADKLPAGKLSTLGAGKTMPDPKQAVRMKDGVVVPCGPGIDSGISGSSLLYNEFIVYDTAQIKMRYLIKMKFDYK